MSKHTSNIAFVEYEGILGERTQTSEATASRKASGRSSPQTDSQSQFLASGCSSLNSPFKYYYVKHLGSGGYGKAYLVDRASDNEKFVAKIIAVETMQGTGAQQVSTTGATNATQDTEHLNSKVASEINNLKAVSDHFGVTRMVEGLLCNGDCIIIMEYCDAGDLYKEIIRYRSEGKYMREEDVRIIFAQLVFALHHLHQYRLMHRDIKAPNVMLCNSGLVKLGDFGLSKVAAEGGAQTFCGTPAYVAPEVWTRKPYTAKADVWSLGVLLYQMMTRRLPFASRDYVQLREKIMRADYERLSSIGAPFSNDLMSLCETLLTPDPMQRPATTELLRNSIISETIAAFPAILKNSPTIQEKERRKILSCLVRDGVFSLSYPSAQEGVLARKAEIVARTSMKCLETSSAGSNSSTYRSTPQDASAGGSPSHQREGSPGAAMPPNGYTPSSDRKQPFLHPSLVPDELSFQQHMNDNDDAFLKDPRAPPAEIGLAQFNSPAEQPSPTLTNTGAMPPLPKERVGWQSVRLDNNPLGESSPSVMIKPTLLAKRSRPTPDGLGIDHTVIREILSDEEFVFVERAQLDVLLERQDARAKRQSSFACGNSFTGIPQSALGTSSVMMGEWSVTPGAALTSTSVVSGPLVAPDAVPIASQSANAVVAPPPPIAVAPATDDGQAMTPGAASNAASTVMCSCVVWKGKGKKKISQGGLPSFPTGWDERVLNLTPIALCLSAKSGGMQQAGSVLMSDNTDRKTLKLKHVADVTALDVITTTEDEASAGVESQQNQDADLPPFLWPVRILRVDQTTFYIATRSKEDQESLLGVFLPLWRGASNP